MAAEADYVVIAYDSPVNDKDEVDISPVTNAARAVGPFLKSETPVIVTSQVPLGSCEKIEAALKEAHPSWTSGVVYTPENLRLGSAIPRFLEPDMLVLGSSVPASKCRGTRALRAVSDREGPHRSTQRRDGEARAQRILGDVDHVHQRDRQPGRPTRR